VRLADRALNISPSPTLAIDARAKEMKAKGVNVISFGAGEPDFDTPAHIKEAAIAAINSGMTKYTAVSGTIELKEAICQRLKLDQGLSYEPNQIVVSSGAKQTLYNAMQVLVQPGDEVIVPVPYWVSYIEQIKLAGAEARVVETREDNGFKLTADELEQAINPRTRLLILNTPNNPTGAVYTREELAALAQVIMQHDIMVLSDEIYGKLVYDGCNHCSIASISPELKDRTVIINGVSKAYAMTGWRIGYAACNAKLAKAMTDLQSHSTSNANSIAQAASVAAISGDQSPTEMMRNEFQKRRNYMLERLRAIPGITCSRPDGAFYLFPNVKSYFGKSYKGIRVNSATDLADLLLNEAKVALVPGISFGNDNYLRLSYACSMENIKEGMDRITSLMANLR